MHRGSSEIREAGIYGIQIVALSETSAQKLVRSEKLVYAVYR